jgi:hypothetical protein
MAKPNYSYEKRQRELAKKKKKEEKAREKADRKTSPGQPGDAPVDGDDPETAVENVDPNQTVPPGP